LTQDNTTGRNGSRAGTRFTEIIMNHKVLLIKTAAILIISTQIYYSDLSLIFGKALQFSEGNISNYVLTIPFLVAFVIYRKRKVLTVTHLIRASLRNTFRIDDILGITLCAAAMMLYTFGSQTLYSLEYHIMSFPVFLAGSTMFLFDIATFRQAIFAIMLTAYLQPPPGFLVSEIAADLSWSAAILVEAFLRLVGMNITLDSSLGAPALLLTMAGGQKIPFFVGEPSSGVFSTIGLTLFALFVSYITRGKLWKRSIVFVIGFPVFYLLNVARISTILSLWYLFGQDVAETYHIVSGSIMVAIGSIILLLASEKMLKLTMRVKSRVKKRCPACERSLANNESLCLYCGSLLKKHDHNIKNALSRIAALSLLGILVLSASIISQPATAVNSSKLSQLDISKAEGSETTNYFLPSMQGWDLSYAYRDKRIESVLNQDLALAFRYVKNDSALPTNSVLMSSSRNVFASVQISTGHHVWEDSLVIYPSRIGRPSATILEISDHDISKDTVGKFLLFKRVGASTTEAVFYWFERVPLRFGQNFENRNVMISLWANTEGLARGGLIKSSDDIEGIKQMYFPMAKTITAFWTKQSAQVISNEVVLAFIREHIVALMALVISPALILLLHHLIRKAGLRKVNKRLYEQLGAQDRSLLAVFTSQDKQFEHGITGELMSKSYQTIMNKQISEAEMSERLRNARKAGLIKEQISSIYDEPLLIWKPLFDISSAISHRAGKHWQDIVRAILYIDEKTRV